MEHLGHKQLEMLASKSAGNELDLALVHLQSCGFCRDKVRAYEAAIVKLNRVQPAARPNGPECPRAHEWSLIATGATSSEVMKEFLLHAAQCNHCGLLVRTTRAFDDEFTRDEEAALSRLKTQPGEQARLAEVLSAKSRAASSNPAPKSRRSAIIYSAVAAVLVIAAGLSLFVALRSESPEKLLAQAYSEQRTLEPRFQGARYGPVQILRGKHGASSLSKPQALLDAESLVHRRLLKEPNNPLWLDAKGRVDLLEANYDAALQAFQKALDIDPDSAALQTDAASAYFERAELADQPDDFGRAVELLSRVLAKTPDDPIALFNRALANEKMFFYHQAVEDWDRYLRLDTKGEWAEEARRRRDALRQKLEQQKQGYNSPLLSPSEFVSEAKRQGRAFGDLVDRRPEDYLDQAIREWLPAAFLQANQRAPSDSMAALRILAEILSKRHGDQWLLDLAEIPHSRAQASAIQRLVAAVNANSTGDFASAREASVQAEELFRHNGNLAGALRAGFETVYALHRSHQESARCLVEAGKMVNQLAGHFYPWLEAQLDVERWNCNGQLAHFTEAEPVLRRALLVAEQSGYQTLKLRVLGMIAGEQYAKGNIVNAYVANRQGLERYWSGIHPPYRAYQFYAEIAFLSEDMGRWNLALASCKEALRFITLAGQPLTEAASRYQLSRYWLATGDVVLAESESHRARALFAGLRQNNVNRIFQADQEIQLAGLEAGQGEIERAWAHLSQAQADLPRTANYFVVLRLFRVLGTLQMLKGDAAQAERALLSAVAIAECGLKSLRDERDRTRWAGESSDVYRKLAQIRWESHDIEGALKVWEWYRARAARKDFAVSSPSRERASSVDFASISAAPLLRAMQDVRLNPAILSAETVLTYMQLPTGLILWVLDDHGVTAKWIASTPEELEQLGRRFRDECAHLDADRVLLRKDGRTLYDLLIAPVADRLSSQRTLVIEPDEALAEVPITALIDPAGHYLAEKYSVVFSSGLLAQSGSRTLATFSTRDRALVVGSPALSGDLATNLEPLADAGDEAREIASKFQTGVFLSGNEATLENLRLELPQATIFHFAGHAVAEGGTPVLLLAGAHPSSGTAVLDAGQIHTHELGRLRLAVLSACSTAPEEKSSNRETLVKSFLRAGVPSVVAARWNVDSAITAQFMQAFYRSLLSGQSVPSSLQNAREQLLHTPATAAPYYWAAFDAFGR